MIDDLDEIVVGVMVELSRSMLDSSELGRSYEKFITNLHFIVRHHPNTKNSKSHYVFG